MRTATENKLKVRREGREVEIGAVEELVQGDQVPCIFKDEVVSFQRLFVGKANDIELLFVGRVDSSLYLRKDMVERFAFFDRNLRIEYINDNEPGVILPSSRPYDYQQVNIKSPDGKIIDYILTLKGM